MIPHGNSLTLGASAPAGFDYPSQLAGIPPLAGTGITPVNCGHSGWNWAQLNGSSGGSTADVDAATASAVAAGKKVVVIGWEGTNDFGSSGYSPTGARDRATTWATMRRAAGATHIILLTCGPSWQSTNTQTVNNNFNNTALAYNALLRSGYRTMGADVLVDVAAPGSVFGDLLAGGDFSQSAFAATSSSGLWNATEVASAKWLHYSSAGYLYIAGLVGAGLRRVPR